MELKSDSASTAAPPGDGVEVLHGEEDPSATRPEDLQSEGSLTTEQKVLDEMVAEVSGPQEEEEEEQAVAASAAENASTAAVEQQDEADPEEDRGDGETAELCRRLSQEGGEAAAFDPKDDAASSSGTADRAESRSQSPSSQSSEKEPPTKVGHVTVSCVKHKVECSRCSTDTSLFWRTAKDGGLLCVACVDSVNPANTPARSTESSGCSNVNGSTPQEMVTKEDPEEDVSQGGSDSPATPMGSVDNEEGEDGPEVDEGRAGAKQPSPRKREVRKGTRMKTAKSVKSLVKGRRTIMFKRAAPAKTAPSVAHFMTTTYIRHKGSYLQSGDIVSMLGDDGETYYAQLRSFLVDQFGQLSATISWLIPSERSPADGSFDAASFVIGPEEDFPRELSSMSFECHAPSDYYLSRSRPVLFDERKACKAFTWTTLGQPKAIWDDKPAEGRHHLPTQ